MTARTYKVICVSLYHEDLKALDRLVDKLKAEGLGRASRSSLIRYAVKTIDLEAFARTLNTER